MSSKLINKTMLTKMGRRTFISAAAKAAVGLSLVVGGAAHAATTLKWAHVYEASTPYHQAALWAADEVEKRTDGRVTIKTYPASSLGKEVEINEGLSIGSIDLIYTGVAFAGNTYGPMAMSDYPFVMRGYDHWKTYRDSDLFAEIKDGYKNVSGHEVSGYVYYGARHVTSNKPVLKPEDMKDMKIRVPNAPIFMMFPRAVDANPTPLAFSEVYLALQQGVVDAQENPLPTIKFKKFYEVQTNINLTGHITNSIVVVASGLTKSKLSDEDYATVTQVTKEASARASNEIYQSEQELVSWFREQGVTVNEVDVKPFQDAVKPLLESGDDIPFTSEQLQRLQAL